MPLDTECILALGTSNPVTDTKILAGRPNHSWNRLPGDWALIEGELMTFADPPRDLPSVDRLEGFRPHGHSRYRRELVALQCAHGIFHGWTYDGAGLTSHEVRVRAWRE